MGEQDSRRPVEEALLIICLVLSTATIVICAGFKLGPFSESMDIIAMADTKLGALFAISQDASATTSGSQLGSQTAAHRDLATALPTTLN